jgi:hypothetical protein
MIYDSISNYAISVNLGHFTGLFTGTNNNIYIIDINDFIVKKKFLVLLQEEFEDTKGAIMYLKKLFLVPLQISFNMQLFHLV